MPQDLLNTREVAEYLGIHEKQVYALIKAKRIPATRLTGKWMFPRRLLDERIEADARRAMSRAREKSRSTEGALLAGGSDDPVLGLLAGELRKAEPGLILFLAALGSTEGLRSLNRGEVDLTFSHLLDPETGEYNLPFLPRLVPDRAPTAVNVFFREVGLVVARGNPKRLRGFKDLGKHGLRLVNRQAGAGTRLLLEQELARLDIAGPSIVGWNREASTHHEVALAVRTGEADVGMAVSSVARIFDLGFVPLREERFDMVLDRSLFFEQRFQALLDRMASAPFRERVGRIGGYDFRECGKVLTREA
jgi:putative molybdopterin biosynthesis protein